MSAFLCPAEHIGVLVRFAADHRLRAYGNVNGEVGERSLVIDSEEARDELAEILARENLASLVYRYPDTGGAADWCGMYENDTGYIRHCQYEAKRSLTVRRPAFVFSGHQGLANLYGMANCYDYQSCEHPEHRETLARAMVLAIRDKCWRLALPTESEAAMWTYYEPDPESVAV